MKVKLKPAIKSYLWGGTKLHNEYGKDGETISESWELSFHKDGLTIIDSGENKGKTLSEVCTKKDFGENCAAFPFFPTLIKMIDADKPLSVQVHPSDEYALKNEGQFGKTEMWHVLDAEDGAYLYLGLNRSVDKEEFARAIENKSVCDLLNKVPVKKGDTYFIESGTIHAIGAGITLYEVQQNSSLTYRVYDFDRVDKAGNRRELHIEKAKAVADLDKYEVPDPARKGFLGGCPYFSTYKVKGSATVGEKDSFVCVTVTEGEYDADGIALSKGDSFFVSAGEKTELKGDGEFLSTCVK
ncbi:MAG: class I mannose-6-phosphate isomerase [Clostridia bacterium]|nr:class I mannose-6-phosphate isomerase [Clostridia bacterium]